MQKFLIAELPDLPITRGLAGPGMGGVAVNLGAVKEM